MKIASVTARRTPEEKILWQVVAPASAECSSNPGENMTLRTERRSHLRLALHTPVYVACGVDGDFVETTTRDISAGGFYCSARVPVRAGQEIDCIIVIPGSSAESNGQLRLKCKAEVVRVEPLEDSSRGFGIACHIQRYAVLLGDVHR
jgi:hypothetical protein